MQGWLATTLALQGCLAMQGWRTATLVLRATAWTDSFTLLEWDDSSLCRKSLSFERGWILFVSLSLNKRKVLSFERTFSRDRRGLNSQPPAWQAGALTKIELPPQWFLFCLLGLLTERPKYKKIKSHCQGLLVKIVIFFLNFLKKMSGLSRT